MSDTEMLLKALQQAVDADPDNIPLRRHLAELLMANGRYTRAEQELRKVLAATPDDTAVKLALGKAFHHQEKWMMALVVLEELVDSGQAPPLAHLLAARVYLQTSQPDKAAAAYQRAIQLDPGLADEALAKQLPAETPRPTDDTPSRPGPSDQAGPSSPGPNSDDQRIKLPADGWAADAPDEVERSAVTFDDVGGMDDLKEEIRIKIIHPLSNPELYQAYGKPVGGGILMYGPPGCGKTHLARATAGEVNAYFLSIGIHDVLNMYLGQSEHNLHNLFELARRYSPCVIFIDEIDALGAKRTDMRHSAGRHVINQLLAELDGIDVSNEGMLVLAATNAPWHLDPALRRPGRFDRIVFVPPPDVTARAAILQVLLRGKPVDHIDYERVAAPTQGFSGADLKGVVDSAVEHKLREAIRQGTPQPLTTNDLLQAARRIKPSTQDWFATARNYALYANQGGLYDDVLDYLNLDEDGGLFSRFNFWKDRD